jgi:hypothetical protein
MQTPDMYLFSLSLAGVRVGRVIDEFFCWAGGIHRAV